MKKIIFCWLLLSSSCVFAGVFSCTAPDGSKLFTDDRTRCVTAKVKEIIVDTPKPEKEKVNFRYPTRSYHLVAAPFTIYVEQPLFEHDKALTQASVDKLQAALNEIFLRLPPSSHEKLKPLKFFVMWGDKSPQGGEKSGMRYVGVNSANRYSLYDTQWKNAIIIYSAENLLYLTDLWTKKALTHELAHAWHLLNRRSDDADIMNSWMNSRSASLYLSVVDLKGKTLAPAYASTNQLEYFAELSAMYFVGGNYFPFDSKGLEQYDPKGFSMIEEVWGLK
jgi:hypothetical protein